MPKIEKVLFTDLSTNISMLHGKCAVFMHKCDEINGFFSVHLCLCSTELLSLVNQEQCRLLLPHYSAVRCFSSCLHVYRSLSHWLLLFQLLGRRNIIKDLILPADMEISLAVS